MTTLKRYIPLSIIMAIGITLSFALFITGKRWEKLRLQSDIDRIAIDRLRALQRNLDRDLEILYSIAEFYESSREVERHEFRAFVSGALERHPEIRALEWAPRIPASQREDFERGLVSEKMWDAGIFSWEKQKRVRSSSDRKEFFPIHFVEPMEPHRFKIGYDLSSEVRRRDAMKWACDWGAPAATELITLMESPDESESGIRVFMPIFRKDVPTTKPEERRANLAGYAVAVFSLGEIIRLSMMPLHPEDVDIFLFDVTDSRNRVLLHFQQYQPAEWSPPPFSSTILPSEEALMWGQHFEIAGREWEIVCRPTKTFLARQLRWIAEIALVAGLAFTAMVGIYLLTAVHRTAQIERLVHHLTTEIGDRRRAEEALRLAERQTRENADELARTNVELMRANDKLKELDHLKNEFLAMISHELRTPLATIIGAMENLLSGMAGRVTEHQQRILDIVTRNAMRLSRLIENLLDLSLIEAGRFTMRLHRIDLRTPIKLAVDSLRPVVENGGKQLTVDLPAEPLMATADSDRMVQVVTNLVDNASRFATQSVSVSLKSRDGEAVLEVNDDGPGLAEEDLPKLFQKFTRIGAIGSYSHMGLGLSIVKAIADAHSGRVVVERLTGEKHGTRFIVTIPAG